MSSRKKKVRRPAASPAKRRSGKPVSPLAAALIKATEGLDLDLEPDAWSKVHKLAREIGMSTLADIVTKLGELRDPAPNPDHLIEGWRDFTAAYRTPIAAKKAAAAGRDVSADCRDQRLYTFEMVATPDGPRAHHTAWTAFDLQALTVTTMLNAEDPDAAIQTICQVLDSLVAPHGPFCGISAVCVPSTTSMPRFGWRHTFDAFSWKTWDDYYDAYEVSGLRELEDLVDHAGDLTHDPRGCAEYFRAAGLPVTLCQRCGHPLTDRHPDWPGTWASADGMLGPVCDPDGEGFGGDTYDRIHYGSPHQAGTEPGAVIPHQRFARSALIEQGR